MTSSVGAPSLGDGLADLSPPGRQGRLQRLERRLAFGLDRRGPRLSLLQGLGLRRRGRSACEPLRPSRRRHRGAGGRRRHRGAGGRRRHHRRRTAGPSGLQPKDPSR